MDTPARSPFVTRLIRSIAICIQWTLIAANMWDSKPGIRHSRYSFPSPGGRPAASVPAAGAVKGTPCRFVNGCPAALESSLLRPAYCPCDSAPAPVNGMRKLRTALLLQIRLYTSDTSSLYCYYGLRQQYANVNNFAGLPRVAALAGGYYKTRPDSYRASISG